MLRAFWETYGPNTIKKIEQLGMNPEEMTKNRDEKYTHWIGEQLDFPLEIEEYLNTHYNAKHTIHGPQKWRIQIKLRTPKQSKIERMNQGIYQDPDSVGPHPKPKHIFPF